MREIKFRAWDKERGKIWVWGDTGYCLWLNEVNQSTGFPLSNIMCNPKRFELQQYTGLKDKNGKEIYEGDILNLHEERDTDKTNEYEHGRGVVRFGEWDCACGDYYCSDEGVGWYVEGTHGYKRRSGKLDSYEFLETIRHCDRWEVIGNIYENKELLNEG